MRTRDLIQALTVGPLIVGTALAIHAGTRVPTWLALFWLGVIGGTMAMFYIVLVTDEHAPKEES